jgi:transposase
MESQVYSSQTLDHLGLVAGMCRELGIRDLIDKLCPSDRPDQIVSTGQALEEILDPDDLDDLGVEGYQSVCHTVEYAQIDQHGVIYRSEKAEKREGKTLQRRIDKEAIQIAKSWKKLQKQTFHCKEDAEQATQGWQQQWKWHRLDKLKIGKQKKYEQARRPHPESPSKTYYTIEAILKLDEQKQDNELFRRSLFILATNQILNINTKKRNSCKPISSNTA